jgi:50S ribosomal subunit-associated GTPase HflX
MVTLLVGNKSDLAESRAVNQNEINELISKYSFDYVEISAKTGNFVKTAFETLTKLIMIKNDELSRLNKSKKKDRSQNVTLNKSVITLDQTSKSDKMNKTSLKCCKV